MASKALTPKLNFSAVKPEARFLLLPPPPSSFFDPTTRVVLSTKSVPKKVGRRLIGGPVRSGEDPFEPLDFG